MIKWAALMACGLIPLIVPAQASRERPRVVVGLVVDQMRWDYLYRFYDRYGEDGFRRLMREGFSCEQTFVNYLPSYTAPGHATVYTGTTPAFHGIVGNDWPDAGVGSVYCCADTTEHAVGGAALPGKMSPRNLKATTIGDELRLATNFRSRVFGVSLKDRGAILPAGHSANGAFWFDDSSGNFISSSYYYRELPGWVKRFNGQRYADSLLSVPWTRLSAASGYVQSIADDNPHEYTMKGEQSPVFPHAFRPGDYKALRRAPAGNQLSFLFARELMDAEHLGSTGCDMLALSLSATDYIGHAYAPNSMEAEDTYLRLDRQLAAFLRFLDERYGKGNYLMFLTADHGAAHNSEWLRTHNIPAGSLSETELGRDLNKSLKHQFGVDSLVRTVMNYQVFFDESRLERQRLERARVKAAAIRWCNAQPGVAAAVDLESVAVAAVPGIWRSLLENGYYPARCGSISVIYEPGWYSDGRKGTTHGTWNPYDRHIPLLWYGKGVPQGSTYLTTDMTDIAVTLAALLHIQMPNAATGKVITELCRKP